MKNILIINAHQPHPISSGELNDSIVERLKELLPKEDFVIKETVIKDGYDIDDEVSKLVWADIIFLQTPLNWMNVSWSYKKYQDEVFSTGMDGRLCNGDGRTLNDTTQQYGSGGTRQGTKYMISVTMNSPKFAFENPSQHYFESKSLDDLLWHTHLNFKFMGMEPLPTFGFHDVLKNPDIEGDLRTFEKHIKKYIIDGEEGEVVFALARKDASAPDSNSNNISAELEALQKESADLKATLSKLQSALEDF